MYAPCSHDPAFQRSACLFEQQMVKKFAWIVLGLSSFCFSTSVLAEASSIDEQGIDALRLHKSPYNLIGRKIAIGQVEIGRPGQFGLDKAVSSNRAVTLAGVFLRDQPAKSNSSVDPHAENVAGVMVSTDKALPGVAPGARLYAAAVGSLKTGGQPEECLSAQYVALQNGGDVRSINFSFGEPLERDARPNASLDGNALLTECIDWSARVHNVLYAIAGNQGKGGIPIPTDNFNGVTVAFSSRLQKIFSKVDVSNLATIAEGFGRHLLGREFNLAARSSVSLVAPGSNIRLLNPDGKLTKVTGTSFAAPHVTATLALLQEFGDRQLRMHKSNWSLDSRRHELMKAVLLNSADKIQDFGDGLRLGMSRTLIDKLNRDWLLTEAYKNPKIPLDPQMGAGHLNAFRAYQQFSAGQWTPNTVPAIGWDYRSVDVDKSNEYVFKHPLKAKSFVALTLAWDRLVELNDSNKNGQYDVGETFSDRGVNRLDLYLVKADEKNPTKAIACTSTSDVDSVQHIFCPVPEKGNYKIRVSFRQKVNAIAQRYALAWWTVPER